ncbi:hypothetical protein ACFSM5_17000 [Lacibacterium aquatile]|uniref:Phosphatidate cytidylyltransferase n=1 Tax=Lacibacterium aquatile TaxID=1168082 RepID=A0ABW5DUT2_9PROT
MSGDLLSSIATELAAPVPEAIRQSAAALAARGGTGVAGVLFYGSSLRTGDLEGVLDFYVIVDRLKDWNIGTVIDLACRLLPPFVEYAEIPAEGRILRAKVAVLTQGQFADLVRPNAINTTVWARFSQPTALIWARDEASRAELGATIAQAVASAAGWAYALGPVSGTAEDYWRSLFSHTYRAELRVERHDGRSADIVAHGGARYAQLLPLAWQANELAFEQTAAGGLIKTGVAPARFQGWGLRSFLGKPLNIARLIKAAFTFRGGAAYLAWKIERHSGVALNLTPWQQRHPILMAPALLWRLWRRGVVR